MSKVSIDNHPEKTKDEAQLVSPFDKSGRNYNGAVVGVSGSGCSVFLKESEKHTNSVLPRKSQATEKVSFTTRGQFHA